MSEREPLYCDQMNRILRELAKAFCERLGNDRAWGKIKVCIQDGKVRACTIAETVKTE